MKSLYFAFASSFGLLQAQQSFMQLPPANVKPMVMLSESSISCSLFDNLMQFDISSLQNQKEGFYYKDGYFFNFCAQLSLTNDGSQTEAYVFKATNASQTTYTAGMEGTPFTEKILTSSKTGRIDETTGDVNNTVAVDYHIETYFENSVPCGTNTWGTYFEIYCDSSKEATPTSDDFTVTADESTCKLTISTSHNAGCPVFSLQGFMSFLRKIPAVLGILMILLGIACNFFGGLIFPRISGVINATLAFVNSFIMFSLLINSMGPGRAVAILLTLLTIIIGGVLGYFSYKLSMKKRKYGASFMAAFAGLYIGFLLYRFVFQHVFSNTIFMMIVVLASGGASAYYTLKYAEKIICPISIIVGSYLIVRGSSIMIGGVPKSLGLFGDSSNILAVFFYFVAFIGSMILGFSFQRYHGFLDIHELECEGSSDEEEENETHNAKHEVKKVQSATATVHTGIQNKEDDYYNEHDDSYQRIRGSTVVVKQKKTSKR